MDETLAVGPVGPFDGVFLRRIGTVYLYNQRGELFSPQVHGAGALIRS